MDIAMKIFYSPELVEAKPRGTKIILLVL